MAMGRGRGNQSGPSGRRDDAPALARWRSLLDARDYSALSRELATASRAQRPALIAMVGTALTNRSAAANADSELEVLHFLRLPEASRAVDVARRAASGLSEILASGESSETWERESSQTWARAFADTVSEGMMDRGVDHWKQVVSPYVLEQAAGRLSLRFRNADRVVTKSDWRQLVLGDYPGFEHFNAGELARALNTVVARHSCGGKQGKRPGGGAGGENNADLIIRNAAATVSWS